MKKINFDKMNPNEHKSVINAMHEEERDAISNRLHSQIGSHLSIARLFIDSIIEKSEGEIQDLAQKSKDLIDLSISDFKISIQSISPRLLRQFGFSGALYQTIRFYKESHKTKIEFEISGEYHSVSYTEDATLLRLLQQVIEILVDSNEIKHLKIRLKYAENVKLFEFISTNAMGRSFYEIIKKEDWFKLQLRAWVINAQISDFETKMDVILKISI